MKSAVHEIGGRLSQPPIRRIIVIGYGNELRGDDAIGRHIARAINAWQLQGVVSTDLHQLLPETADLIRSFDTVVFIDASLDSSILEVSVTPVIAHKTDSFGTHQGSPESLVALCRAIYGRAPEAWWVRIPVQNVNFGRGLSDAATKNKSVALDKIQWLLKSQAPESFEKNQDLGPNPSHA
jgi:hydrogenase maturation protease